jgi:hypothetical protein
MEGHPDGSRSLQAMTQQASFVRTAWQGGLGLARSFWLLACAGGIALTGAFAVVVQLTNSIALGAIGLLSIVTWQVFSSVATWRAASTFTGPASRAALARAVVIAGNLLLATAVATLVGIV